MPSADGSVSTVALSRQWHFLLFEKSEREREFILPVRYAPARACSIPVDLPVPVSVGSSKHITACQCTVAIHFNQSGVTRSKKGFASIMQRPRAFSFSHSNANAPHRRIDRTDHRFTASFNCNQLDNACQLLQHLTACRAATHSLATCS